VERLSGYTSVQVNDFNRAGEDACMLRVGYNFQSVKGSACTALRRRQQPEGRHRLRRGRVRRERAVERAGRRLKGLMVRLRYAKIEQNSPGSPT
jgi:hypothetical protein